MAILVAKKVYPSIAVLLCGIFLLQLTGSVPTTQACVPVQPVPNTKLDVEVDVGSTYFRGEIAEFYVLVSLVGNPTDAEEITANLYYNGTVHSQLSDSIEHVATGLYRIPYTIPMNACTGTYALVVGASLSSIDHKIFSGTTLKSFLLSQTLTGWNCWLTEIRDTIATIKTDVGTIQMSLENINATITNIDGKIVTIETDIGIIKTDIDVIGLTLTNIEGSITTINTCIGNIQGNITSKSFPNKICSVMGCPPVYGAPLMTLMASFPEIVRRTQKKNTEEESKKINYVVDEITKIKGIQILGKLPKIHPLTSIKTDIFAEIAKSHPRKGFLLEMNLKKEELSVCCQEFQRI